MPPGTAGEVVIGCGAITVWGNKAVADVCVPVIMATWGFGKAACEAGARILRDGGAALDAVEAGGNAIELDPTIRSVGYGGLPNADGVVELDAAIMDGRTHAAGSVAGMTGIRRPVSVARRVMERTPHVMLVGDNARRFALNQGFVEEDLLTRESRERYHQWLQSRSEAEVAHFQEAELSHDTVGVVALDASGGLAASCTTSGLAWKLPGRVGDSPIVGSGLYVDQEAGAAASTGNGDEIMKVCLSYRIVASMAAGRDPQEACEEAIAYLLRKRPGRNDDGAACIAVRKDGRMGAAATQAGFRRPDRMWIYASWAGANVDVREGAYVVP